MSAGSASRPCSSDSPFCAVALGGDVVRRAIFNREARELDALAAVEERWRDGVERIGRTDEKNLFIEGDVLLRVEQGCRETAAIA